MHLLPVELKRFMAVSKLDDGRFQLLKRGNSCRVIRDEERRERNPVKFLEVFLGQMPEIFWERMARLTFLMSF